MTYVYFIHYSFLRDDGYTSGEGNLEKHTPRPIESIADIVSISDKMKIDQKLKHVCIRNFQLLRTFQE